ncbi:MAG: adenine phosphoribosyltransferase, partial [Bacteroidota bacterium]
MDLKKHIRSVPDFPKPGILFYDISTLLAHPGAWQEAMRLMSEMVAKMNPDVLIGVESRGFLVAAPLALQLNKGFVMVRKKGKLPGSTIGYEYDLEYGTDTIEVQDDIIKPGARVVILDDLLATGGTLAASIELIQEVGGDFVGTA